MKLVTRPFEWSIKIYLVANSCIRYCFVFCSSGWFFVLCLLFELFECGIKFKTVFSSVVVGFENFSLQASVVFLVCRKNIKNSFKQKPLNWFESLLIPGPGGEPRTFRFFFMSLFLSSTLRNLVLRLAHSFV